MAAAHVTCFRFYVCDLRAEEEEKVELREWLPLSAVCMRRSYLFPSVVRYLDTNRLVENTELIQYNCCFLILKTFYLEVRHYKVSGVYIIEKLLTQIITVNTV